MHRGYESFATLKMAFDARRDQLLKFWPMPKPPDNLSARFPHAREVNQQGFTFALSHVLQVVVVDDVGLQPVPAEYGEIPFAEAWCLGVADGEAAARLRREVILEALARETGVALPATGAE